MRGVDSDAVASRRRCEEVAASADVRLTGADEARLEYLAPLTVVPAQDGSFHELGPKRDQPLSVTSEFSEPRTPSNSRGDAEESSQML